MAIERKVGETWYIFGRTEVQIVEPDPNAKKHGRYNKRDFVHFYCKVIKDGTESLKEGQTYLICSKMLYPRKRELPIVE